MDEFIAGINGKNCGCTYDCTVKFAPFGDVTCGLFLELEEIAPDIVDFSYVMDLSNEQFIQVRKNPELLALQLKLIADQLEEVKVLFKKMLAGELDEHSDKFYWSCCGRYDRFTELMTMTVNGCLI